MNQTTKEPRIVLIGRMNVGKSTLFNRFAQKQKSMVLDYEGITRDTLQEKVTIAGVSCVLVDTAGIGVKKEDPLQELAQQTTFAAIEQASVVVFVVDAALGLVPEERQMAKWLHTHHVPTIVALNKMDKSIAQEMQYEFQALGFETMIPLSAEHGTGMSALEDAIITQLQRKSVSFKAQEPEEKKSGCRVMLLGKPNAGKSALMNALLGYQRTLVSAIAGTTREPITETITYYQQDFDVIDTAGVRKKAAVDESLEKMMVQSTLSTIDKAHLVLLVVDASEGHLSDQVLKLGFYVFDQRYKAVILILTKYDLVTKEQEAQLTDELKRYDQLIRKIVVLRVSSVTGKNVGRIVPHIQQVCERYMMQVDAYKLYKVFQLELLARPLVRNEIHLLVRNVEQVAYAPLTLKITVDEPLLWEPSHVGFLERLVRSEYDLEGVPVKFILVKKKA